MKYFYSYNEFVEDIDNLTRQLKEFEPDAIIPLARGGLTMGHFLGERLKIRDVCAVNTIHYNGDKKLDTLNNDDWKYIFEYANKKEIPCFSTPFDKILCFCELKIFLHLLI